VVLRPGRQQPTAVLAVLAVLAFGVLPAEHVHLARADDGHHSDVVHRHFEPHHRSATQVAIDDDDDDHDVQWLTTSFTSPDTAGHVCPDRHFVELDLPAPRSGLTSRATVQALFVSVHDPPWATPSGLRAPPASRL